MSFTLTTSGAAIAKAGVNQTAVTTATMDTWSDESEASFSALTQKDWVANFASIGTNYKQAVGDAVSSMIAMMIINNDIGAYPNRGHAQTILDINNNIVTRAISQLKDDNVKKLIS